MSTDKNYDNFQMREKDEKLAFKLIQRCENAELERHLLQIRFKQDIVKIWDKSGYSLLHYAAYKNNERGVEILVRFIHMDFNVDVPCTGETDLIFPTMSKKEKITRACNWINLVSKGDDAFTALHFASFHGNLSMIKYLVMNGANVEARNS